MLLLDEIAGGLTEHEVFQLVDIVKALKRDHAVIWIEHIAHALIAAADRILVLHFGAKLIEGSPPRSWRPPPFRKSIWGFRSMNLLTLEDVDVFYGDLQATFGVSLHVDAGETIAIIGANGAGKSTLLRAIIGLTPTRRGTIILAGEDITRLRCDLVARRGIALVPEGRRLFSSLTVEENLLMGMARARPGPWTLESVYDLFPAMRELRHQPASDISGGQQQMVAIGRALLTNPRLLFATSCRSVWRPRSSTTSMPALPRSASAAFRSLSSSRTCARPQFLEPALLSAEGPGHAGRQRSPSRWTRSGTPISGIAA